MTKMIMIKTIHQLPVKHVRNISMRLLMREEKDIWYLNNDKECTRIEYEPSGDQAIYSNKLTKGGGGHSDPPIDFPNGCK